MHPMAASTTRNRLAALRDLLADQGLDALLVLSPDNRRYLSGFTARDDLLTESSGSLLITREAIEDLDAYLNQVIRDYYQKTLFRE